MSNYLEHLDFGRRRHRAAARCARSSFDPAVVVIVLQPNVRLVGPRYWDFIDHRVALTERSLLEAAELAGPADRRVDHAVPAVLHQGAAADRRRPRPAYLRFRPAWRFLGRQTLYVGERRVSDPSAGAGARDRPAGLQRGGGGRAGPPGARRPASPRAHELVVVYDFDDDTTVPVVERLRGRDPGLRGLRNDLGRGVLNAMKAGIAGTTAPYVLISMADGSDEPHVVDPMVALARDGADVVAASRYMRGGRQIGGPPLKRLLSRDGRAVAALVRRRSDPRPDEQLQALQPALPRSVTDREHGRLRARAGAHGQGDARRPPRRRGARRRGATGPPARATSRCASGCRTTCTGIAPRSWDGSPGAAARRSGDRPAS